MNNKKIIFIKIEPDEKVLEEIQKFVGKDYLVICVSQLKKTMEVYKI